MKALSNSGQCPNCGDGHKSKPFCVYENGHHCFSCGFSKRIDDGYTARVLQRQSPSSPDWPDAQSNPDAFTLLVLKWLTKFGVTPEMCRKHNILCCNDDSVIYPSCYENGELLSYQRRWINSNTRRIITKGIKQPSLLYTDSTKQQGVLVIVEDFLSAIRVSQQYDVVCLWGTKAAYADLQKWFKKYNKCLVWLDNDATKETNSGQIAANKICVMAEGILDYRYKNKSFSPRGQVVCNVVSEQDPKCYTDTEIREYIEGALAYVNIK